MRVSEKQFGPDKVICQDGSWTYLGLCDRISNIVRRNVYSVVLLRSKASLVQREVARRKP